MSQQIFGKEVLPTLEEDAHGLLLDCGFVGLPGQMIFFNDPGNLSGFEPKMSAALDLAVGWGYASFRSGFDPPGWDYRKIAELAGVEYKELQQESGIEVGPGGMFPGSDVLDDRTIVSFTIRFQPNQPDFSADRYGAEFNRAIQSASTFGNAVVVIRGHADPTKALIDMIKAGMEKGVIKRTGQSGNYRYFVQGKALDLTQTQTIIKLIESGAFETRNHKPRETVQAALNLSLARAEAVKKSLVSFATAQSVNLDAAQLQPTGAGISEPIIPKPSSFDEAQENMRVEFRIVRVPAEALQESEFDF
jgi:outer membrane protein OmpA-like peptidoglycan-associated protein